MLGKKFILSLSIVPFILFALVIPVLGIQYSPGVTSGQYMRYGNFVGRGPGYESFNDYSFINLQVTSYLRNFCYVAFNWTILKMGLLYQATIQIVLGRIGQKRSLELQHLKDR